MAGNGERSCARCGAGIGHKRSDARFCSKVCGEAAHYVVNAEKIKARSLRRKRRLAAARRADEEYQRALLEGEGVKQCRACGLLCALDRFTKSVSRRDGLYPYCRRCNSAKQKAYKAAQPEMYQRTLGARREAIRVLVRDAKCGACADCDGTFPPAAMHFHHLDPATKEAAVSKLVSTLASRPRISAEMAKCVLLCANCHAVRHAEGRAT